MEKLAELKKKYLSWYVLLLLICIQTKLEFLSDVIDEGKRKFPDCSLVIGGDFNQWPAHELLQEHPDLTEVQHSPTRQGQKIDRSFTNFGRSVKESGILKPLET